MIIRSNQQTDIIPQLIDQINISNSLLNYIFKNTSNIQQMNHDWSVIAYEIDVANEQEALIN